MRTALIYVGGTVWGSTTRTTKGTPQGGRWWSFGDDWFKSTPRGRCCAGYSRRIFEVGAKELTLSTVQPRVDSTLVCSNMAKRDRLSLTRETLRVFIRSLNEAQHATLPAEVQAWPRADTDTDSLAQRGGRRGAEATEGKRKGFGQTWLEATQKTKEALPKSGAVLVTARSRRKLRTQGSRLPRRSDRDVPQRGCRATDRLRRAHRCSIGRRSSDLGGRQAKETTPCSLGALCRRRVPDPAQSVDLSRARHRIVCAGAPRTDGQRGARSR